MKRLRAYVETVFVLGAAIEIDLQTRGRGPLRASVNVFSRSQKAAIERRTE